MRLTDHEVQTITTTLRRNFGDDAAVWLFGSRTDDRRRGGDIDLLVDADTPRPIVERRLRALVEMKQELGERKIDLLVHRRGEEWLPFQANARAHGIRLA